jgi:hypothetical protein
MGIANARDALAKSLDDDEKGVENIYTPGGPQKMSVINESGLYTLILRSNKPAARPFRKWVTAEVLPAIRKTGSYRQPGMRSQGKPKSIAELSREYHAALRMAKSNGLKGGQAILAANRFTEARTGCCPMDLLGIDPADLYEQDKKESRKREQTTDAPLTGLVPKYLNMLKAEWTAGRTGIQFTEKDKERLEATITMRDLFADFQTIARRYSVPQYRSTKQLALRCSSERDLLQKAGWLLTKTVKVNGIQRWLLIRHGAGEYVQENAAPLLSGEMFGGYGTEEVWS